MHACEPFRNPLTSNFRTFQPFSHIVRIRFGEPYPYPHPHPTPTLHTYEGRNHQLLVVQYEFIYWEFGKFVFACVYDLSMFVNHIAIAGPTLRSHWTG